MKHKHYDVIMAWANGEQLQLFQRLNRKWMDWTYPYSPAFYPAEEYRVKPKIKTIKYRWYLNITAPDYPFMIRDNSASMPYLESKVQDGSGRWISDWLTLEYAE